MVLTILIVGIVFWANLTVLSDELAATKTISFAHKQLLRQPTIISCSLPAKMMIDIGFELEVISQR